MPRTFLALLILVFSSLSLAQNTDGRRSLIPASVLSAVRKTKFRVLVPTYVPAGFKYESGGVNKDPEAALSDWHIRYVNPKTKANIVIQMASDGLGDPMFALPNGDVLDPNGYVMAKSPILGKVRIDYVRKGKYVQANCTWYPVSKKTYPRHAMVLTEGVEPSTAKRVLESLRWLSK